MVHDESEPAVVDDLAHQVQKKYFSDLTQRRTMFISQLPLAVALLLVTVILGIVSPGIIFTPAFEASVVLGLVVTVSCVLVPWHRLPVKSFVIMPLLDFLVIALAREATGETITSLGLLLVFPVIWLSASLGKPGVILSFAGTVLVAAAPLVAGPSTTPSDAIRPFLLPGIMAVIALAVHILVSSIRSQDTKLRLKDAELRRAYEGSLERQRLLDTLLETVGVGVHAVDADGNDILMNQQHRRNRSLAVPTLNPATGEEEPRLLAPDGTTAIPAEQRPVARAASGQSFSDYLVRLGSPTNQRVLSSTARAMTDKDGRFAGSVLAFSDVTDLVNALALKDDFVANISHEFRTPLMSILGYLDIVLEIPEESPGQHESFLRIAQANAEKLLSLVSDLLVTASDSMGVNPHHMDLTDLIGMCLASSRPTAESLGVTLVNEARQPLWITADSARVTQVLDNLLSNAIKYSKPGGTVTVRAWDTPDVTCLSVTDTGIGINDEDLQKIFTKYFRSTRVRESTIPGVGLGLGIVKRIVENHGGSVTASSKPDLGSTFTVTLPKVRP